LKIRCKNLETRASLSQNSKSGLVFLAQGSAVQYEFEGCCLDLRRGCLLDPAERPVPLRPKSFEVLRFLVENAGRLITKEELISSVWQQPVVSDESISHCIGEARAAIADRKHKVIKTVPRRGYLFAATVSRRPEENQSGSGLGPSLAPGPKAEKASIAVLAFANLSGDTANDYVSDGITDDIITELSRFPELFVIARNSSFQYRDKSIDARTIGRQLDVRYVLKGSVRLVTDRIRIAVHLVDAETQAHRWAERYDRQLNDVFAIQVEVARAIATILAAHLTKVETERTLTKAPADWQAYDFYLRAAHSLTAFLATHRTDDLWTARRFAERAIALDPQYALAYSLLSSTYVIDWLNVYSTDAPTALDRARALAARAVQLDASLPKARVHLANVLSWQGQHEAGLAEFERAIALNPNFADYRFATALTMAGEAARAVEVSRDYMRADPFAPATASGWLGAAHYLLREYSRAREILSDCVARMPLARFGRVFLAATCAQLGELDRARAEVAEVLRLEPRFTLEGMCRLGPGFKVRADAEHYREGLIKAGMPERAALHLSTQPSLPLLPLD
jgi:adenylate cyclase